MNFTIPGGNLKIFGRALQALCRFGDQLHLQPFEDRLSIHAFNMTKTAYAVIDYKSNFFSEFQLDNEIVNTDSLDSLKCIVSMKSIMSAFKNASTLEQKMVNCKIKYTEDDDCLLLKFRYKKDIIKTHRIPLLDGEVIQKLQVPHKFPNTFTTNGGNLTHALQNFNTSDNEISFEVTTYRLIIRNYMKNDVNSKQMRSQITINSTDFHNFVILKPADIQFSQKYFRAVISLAEVFHLDLVVNFGASGKPLMLLVKHEGFEGKFILSTVIMDHTPSLDDSVSKKRKLAVEIETPATHEEDWGQISQAMLQDDDFEEILSQSRVQQPAKKATLDNRDIDNSKLEIVSTVFKRCFEATYDPAISNNVDIILAEDSD